MLLNVKKLSIVFFFLIVSLSGQAIAEDLARAEPESVGMSSEQLAAIKPHMQAYIDEGKLAGMITVIARKGKIVHFERVGKLNLDTGEELKDDSLFRIYSMTKPIVSAAAMMLYEEGKFQLDDPVEKFLPEFKGVKVLIDGEMVEPDHLFTVRELMSHSAGLSYGWGMTEGDVLYQRAALMKSKNLQEFVGKISELPLLYQPGSRWMYSLSVDVLGRFIEVIAKQPLDEFLDERMFTPIGMDDTFFEVPQDKLARFGTNHIQTPEGALFVTDRPATSDYAKDVTFFSGGGGLVSTAMDYLRFSQMLLNGGILDDVRLLKADTVALMTANHLKEGISSGFGERLGVKRTFGFGLGVGVAVEKPLEGPGNIGEYNWGGAAGTVFWNDPKEELTAVLMVQMFRNPYDLRKEFRALTHDAIIQGAND